MEKSGQLAVRFSFCERGSCERYAFEYPSLNSSGIAYLHSGPLRLVPWKYRAIRPLSSTAQVPRSLGCGLRFDTLRLTSVPASWSGNRGQVPKPWRMRCMSGRASVAGRWSLCGRRKRNSASPRVVDAGATSPSTWFFFRKLKRCRARPSAICWG